MNWLLNSMTEGKGDVEDDLEKSITLMGTQFIWQYLVTPSGGKFTNFTCDSPNIFPVLSINFPDNTQDLPPLARLHLHPSHKLSDGCLECTTRQTIEHHIWAGNCVERNRTYGIHSQAFNFFIVFFGVTNQPTRCTTHLHYANYGSKLVTNLGHSGCSCNEIQTKLLHKITS